MKTLFLLLSVVLLLTAGAWCQSTGSLTASSTDCSVSTACLVVPLSVATSAPTGSISITIAGTFSATVQFEASGDNKATWAALNCYPTNSTSGATSTTAVGLFQCNAAAYTNFRLRVSAYTSGTVAVTIQTSTASARSGGGGGTGAVSSVTGAGTVSCSPTTGSVVCTGTGGGTPAGTTNDVQFNTGGSFAADTGIFTYTPSTHILNAGQGITTGSGSGVATTLGLSGGTTPGSFPTNAFGWLGPSSATFTSYFFQCPTTPPTNGQTIIFGTQVGSVVPCTYGSGSGTVTSSGSPVAPNIAAFSTSTNIVPASVADIEKLGYAAGGGTGDVQILTLSPVPTILTGTEIRWLPAAANTIAVPTLAVNTLGAKPVVKVCGGSITALVGGDLATTVNAIAIYDGTNWVLQNPAQGCLIYNTVSTFTELTSLTNIGSPITIFDLSAGGSVDTTIAVVISFAITTAGTGTTGTTGTIGIGLLGVDADNGTAYNSFANSYRITTLGSGGGSPSNNCLLVNITSVVNSTCNTVYLVKRFKAGTAVQIVLNQAAVANWGTTQPGVTMRPYVYKIQ